MSKNVIKTISLPMDLVEFLEKQEDIKLSKYIQEQLKNERRLREGRTLQIDRLKADLDKAKRDLAFANSWIFQSGLWEDFSRECFGKRKN